MKTNSMKPSPWELLDVILPVIGMDDQRSGAINTDIGGVNWQKWNLIRDCYGARVKIAKNQMHLPFMAPVAEDSILSHANSNHWPSLMCQAFAHCIP